MAALFNPHDKLVRTTCWSSINNKSKYTPIMEDRNVSAAHVDVTAGTSHSHVGHVHFACCHFNFNSQPAGFNRESSDSLDHSVKPTRASLAKSPSASASLSRRRLRLLFQGTGPLHTHKHSAPSRVHMTRHTVIIQCCDLLSHPVWDLVH